MEQTGHLVDYGNAMPGENGEAGGSKDVSAELEQAAKLELSERVTHKNRMVREGAFEYIVGHVNDASAEAEPKWDDLGGFLVKGITDTLTTVQDNALDALVAYLKKAPEAAAARIAKAATTNLVGKCLGGKGSTNNKATEAFMLFVELEQHLAVQEALVSVLNDKKPKVFLAALEVLLKVVVEFGPKLVDSNKLTAALCKCFDAKDGKTRDKAREVVSELARRTGGWEAMLPALDKGSVKDAIKSEIQKKVETGEKPAKPIRFTRKVAATRAKAAPPPSDVVMAEAGEHSGAAAAGAPEPMDIDDEFGAPPKDVAAQLKKDTEFWKMLGSAVWKERKEALATLKKALSYPAITPKGEWADVNTEVKKIINADSNTAVRNEAISASAAMARGLKREYAGPARTLFPILMEKLKDKSASVHAIVLETLEAYRENCFNLMDVAEEINETLGSAVPMPIVQKALITWLTDALPCEKTDAKKFATTILPHVAKLGDAADKPLREAALNLLVVLAVTTSDQALEKHIAKMDEGRRKTLLKMVEGARSTGVLPSSKPPAINTRNLPARGPGGSEDNSPQEPAPASARTARPGTGKPAAKGAAASAGAAAPKADTEDDVSLLGQCLTRNDTLERFHEFLGDEAVAQLQAKEWKTRLDALEAITTRAKAGELAEHCNSVVQGMAHLPGWEDNQHFQVSKAQFDLVAIMAECPTFNTRDAVTLVEGCINKMSDTKMKEKASEALLAACAAVGPQLVMRWMHTRAVKHNSPKVTSEVVLWMATAVKEFGMQAIDGKMLLGACKEYLASSQAGIRNAAIQLVGAMHCFMGPVLVEALKADIKPALMSSVETACKSNPHDPSAEPRRVARAGKGAAGKAAKASGSAAKRDSEPSSPMAMDDLVPRKDISGPLAELVPRLSDKDWKVRKAAIDEADKLLDSAGCHITPNLADIFSGMKLVLADTNKAVTVAALKLAAKLARSVGRPAAREIRPVQGAIIKAASDPNKLTREAVTHFLEAMQGAAPIAGIVSEVADAVALPKFSADGKALVVLWLDGAVHAGATDTCVPDCLRVVAVCAADKAAEVRDAAGKLVASLAAQYPMSDIASAMASLDAAQKKAANEAFAKAGPGIATASMAKPLATGAAGAPKAAAPGASRPPTAPKAANAAALNTAPSATISRAGSNASSIGASAAGSAKPSHARSSSQGSLMMDASEEPLLQVDNKKEARAQKNKFKPMKYELRADETAEMEAVLSPLASARLRAALFDKDFKRHCDACDMLREAVTPGSAINCEEAAVACLDLLLRWAVVRLSEGNTQLLVKLMEFLKAMFDALSARGYKLSDYEARCLLPCLVEKSGQPNESIRKDFRSLMDKAAGLYAPSKLLLAIKDGLESKNNRTRVACAEELACLFKKEGAAVYRANKLTLEVLPALARLVAERDKDSRGAALAAIGMAYALEAEGVWNLLGRLTDQQKTIIEERLKSMDKELAKDGRKPGYLRMEVAASLAAREATAAASGAASSIATTSSAALPPLPLTTSQSFERAPSAGPPSSRPAESPRVSAVASPSAMRHTGSGAAPTPRGNAAAVKASLALLQTAPAAPSPPAHMQTSPTASSVGGGHFTDEQVVEQFERALETIENGDLEAATEVMKALCYELMDPAKAPAALMQLFGSHADALVHLLTQRTHQVFSEAGRESQPAAISSRACKYCLNTLMNMFANPVISAKVAVGTLQNLVSVLLLRLVDEALGRLPEGEALLKALNVLVLKILENCNRTHTFAVLLVLLRSPHADVMSTGEGSALAGRWYDLVVKCLIKLTKALPATLESVDIGALLVAIHSFFESLGVDEIRKRGAREDKPLRMVKTILHELCKLKGADIYRYTDRIGEPNAEHKPIIFPYIELNLQTITQTATTVRLADTLRPSGIPAAEPAALPWAQPAAPAPAPPARIAPVVPAVASAASKDGTDGLAAIFKRIGESANREAALLELHHFLAAHPQVDVASYLANSSDQFRAYIYKGLAKVRSTLAFAQPHAAAHASVAQHAAASASARPAPLGVAPSGSGGGAVADKENSPTEEAAVAAAAAAARASGGNNLAELRDRLNKTQVAPGAGGPSAPHVAPAKQSSLALAELQERMKKLKSAGAGGGEATDAPKSHADQ